MATTKDLRRPNPPGPIISYPPSIGNIASSFLPLAHVNWPIVSPLSDAEDRAGKDYMAITNESLKYNLYRFFSTAATTRPDEMQNQINLFRVGVIAILFTESARNSITLTRNYVSQYNKRKRKPCWVLLSGYEIRAGVVAIVYSAEFVWSLFSPPVWTNSLLVYFQGFVRLKINTNIVDVINNNNKETTKGALFEL